MTDADSKTAPPADDSASDAEKTDEQLWEEMGSSETDTDADNAPADDADDVGVPVADEPDDDPGPSDDTDTDAGDDGPTDGMDHEALQVQHERLLKALDSEKGRSAGGRREIERLESQIASDKSEQSGDPDDDDNLREKREKLDAAREEYSDVVGPLTDEVAELRAQIADGKKQKAAEEARELDYHKARHDELVEAQTKIFKGEHSDGLDIITKHREVFSEWIDDQNRQLRDIYVDNHQDIVNGLQAAYLVTRFKQALLGDPEGSAPANPETERLQDRRQRQLAGARSLRTSNTQAATSRPAKDSDDLQGHWDYLKRQEQREERDRR